MKDFLIENKEVFEVLANKIREIDTCFMKGGEIEMKARQIAIELVLGWVEELWGIKKEKFTDLYRETTKENDIFKYRDTE